MSADWLAGWLAGQLAGWKESPRLNRHHHHHHHYHHRHCHHFCLVTTMQRRPDLLDAPVSILPISIDSAAPATQNGVSKMSIVL